MGGAPLEIIKQYIEPQKYVWKPDPSFVLDLPLSADGGEEPGLSARFEGARQLHDAVLGEECPEDLFNPRQPPLNSFVGRFRCSSKESRDGYL